MSLKLNVAIPNKVIHLFIAIVVLVSVAGAFAYSNGIILNFAGPDPASIPAVGHSSEQVVINLGASTGNPCSGDVTLQSALDNDCFNALNPSIPICVEGEILKSDSSNEWRCVADETVQEIICGADEYLKYDGSEWQCDAQGPCTPNNACAAVTCVGSQCSDSCGTIYNGTKTDGVCCVDTVWAPATSTVCSGTSFTQTSNCGRTRNAVGTKVCPLVCSGGVSTTCTLCVDGDISACFAYGGEWTGTHCCVSDITTCAPGDVSACFAYGGIWTGTYCCAKGICVTGDVSMCFSSGGVWTGDYCCFEGDTVCTSGNWSSCSSSGGDWSGDYCCT